MIRRQLLIAAACLSAVGAAKAFTIPGVGGGDKSGQAGAGVTDALLKKQDKLQKDTFGVMKLLVSSQIDLAVAINAKEKIKELKAIEKSLKSGNVTEDHVEKITTVSKDMNDIVNKQKEEQVKLDKKRSEAFTKACVKYAGACAATGVVSAVAVKVGEEALQAVKSAGIAGALTAKKQLDFTLNVASELPGLVKQVVITGNSFVAYGRANGLNMDAAAKKLASAVPM